jgi:hypothetical protein
MIEKRRREGPCFECNKNTNIVNRTKWLCTYCNTNRLSKQLITKKREEKIICKKCKKENTIVNNTHTLCQECNHLRIHKKTIQETLLEQQQKQQQRERLKPIKKQKTTQQVRKEQNTKQLLSELKKEIENEALDNDTYYCKGCGASYLGLDKSHILSVGQRKDLELEKENIDLLCRDCHVKWESGDILKQSSLNCFERYLEYIKMKDTPKYYSLISKLENLLK